METRNRNRRGDGPAVPSTSNRTRAAAQQTRNDAEFATETDTVAESRLSLPPPPRRSAPKGKGPAASVASIPTQHERDSDDEADASGPEELEHAEALGGEGTQVKQQVAKGFADAAAADDVGGEDYSRGLMKVSLPDIDHEAREVVKMLNSAAPKNEVFREVFKRKRKQFKELRELYQDLDSPDTSLINLEIAQEADLGPAARRILFRANLVTALDEIDSFLHDAKFDHLNFFEVLDRYASHRLFRTKEYLEQTANLAIDIRTQLVIARYAANRSMAVNRLLAAAFLEADQENPNDSPMLEAGNIRSLGSEDPEREADACSERIDKLATIFKDSKNKKPAVLKKLKADFPAQRCVEALRFWLIGQHELLDARGQEGDVFQDAREELDESVAESQAITRMNPGQLGPSLFRSEESVRALNEPLRSLGPPPTSGQPPSNAPSDYVEDTSSQLLQDIPTSSNFHHLSASYDMEPRERDRFMPVGAARRPGKATRPARPSSSGYNPKRPRLSPPAASSSMIPPPRPFHLAHEDDDPSRGPGSSVLIPPSSADYSAIQARKRQLTHQVRQINPPTHHRQRQPWSEHDCNLLIHLTQKHNASWSLIEQHENESFQYPRNQQAYRDKARNLKVDFLLTDAILPPGFDLVMLGPKEIKRLEGMGKNPFRRERDHDGDTPIHTELRPVVSPLDDGQQ